MLRFHLPANMPDPGNCRFSKLINVAALLLLLPLLALLPMRAIAQQAEAPDRFDAKLETTVNPPTFHPLEPQRHMAANAPLAVSDLKRLATEAAVANDLPADYFLRLIHRESGFDQTAVSPAGAQGIAQFMPATAQDRGLKDPFDPKEALPKSAALLGDLKKQFGNLGLAAAAYNAGPRRVQEWLAGRAYLPRETRAYVYMITGRPAEDWAPPSSHPLKENDAGVSLLAVVTGKPIETKKNWELALLLSISSSEADKTLALVSAMKRSQPAPKKGRETASSQGRRRLSSVEREASLCNSCIVRSFY